MGLKREIFNRSTRFTHRFGESAYDDPFGSGYFDHDSPRALNVRRSRALTAKTDGVHEYRQKRSAIELPGGGMASFNGPAPDPQGAFALPIPQSTKKRKFR